MWSLIVMGLAIVVAFGGIVEPWLLVIAVLLGVISYLLKPKSG